MKSSKNTAGFTVFEFVLIVGVVGILGLVGYNVYSRNQTTTTDSGTSVVAEKNTPDAPEIKSEQGLTDAEKVLDQTDVDNSSESAQLDADLASF